MDQLGVSIQPDTFDDGARHRDQWSRIDRHDDGDRAWRELHESFYERRRQSTEVAFIFLHDLEADELLDQKFYSSRRELYQTRLGRRLHRSRIIGIRVGAFRG